MEANKEQSDRCVQIAKDKLLSGETHHAIKFLQKSLRLDPSNKIAQSNYTILL